jgi:hypothetical protein
MRATYQTRPSSIPRMHAWRGSRSSRRWEWALLAFAVAASTALLGVATFGTRHGHAWPSLVLPSVAHHNLLPHHTAAHIGSSRAQRGSQGRQQQQQQQLRQQHIHMRPRGALEFPLWWHAPFIAQSGKWGWAGCGVCVQPCQAARQPLSATRSGHHARQRTAMLCNPCCGVGQGGLCMRCTQHMSARICAPAWRPPTGACVCCPRCVQVWALRR